MKNSTIPLIVLAIFGSILVTCYAARTLQANSLRDSCVDVGVMVIDDVTFECKVKSVKISNSVHWILPEEK